MALSYVVTDGVNMTLFGFFVSFEEFEYRKPSFSKQWAKLEEKIQNNIE